MRVAGVRVAALSLLCAAGGCATLSPPLVQSELLASAPPDLLHKVAVAPFQPDPAFRSGRGSAAVPATLAADLVTRFVAEALTARGISVVAPNDLVVAFEGQGMVLPRADAVVIAELAARQFGATAVVVGVVQRYQEREGGSSGALRPASVGFDFSLHGAPGSTAVYRAHFDQTQPALSANVFTAVRYPGNGTRWLTAAELARWGADLAAAEIPSGLE